MTGTFEGSSTCVKEASDALVRDTVIDSVTLGQTFCLEDWIQMNLAITKDIKHLETEGEIWVRQMEEKDNRRLIY